MGSVLSMSESYTHHEPTTNSICIIHLNQAICGTCHKLVRDHGVCDCGNLTVYGGSEELGRIVKKNAVYTNCNLLEYIPK